MNTDKLKGKRVERRYTQSDIAKIIERSTDAYAKKERGVTEFTPYQIAVIAKALNLTLSDFDDIFFDGRLPFGKNGGANYENRE